MLVAPLFVAPVIALAIAMIVGLGPTGDGKEEKTGSDDSAGEMGETH